jgi:DNA-directed RNA polymerase specialized sigma24 family protein
MTPHDRSDDILVERFRGGDQACFNELFRRHKPRVYACCLAFVRNTGWAEDLTQEAFIRAYEHIEQYQGGAFRAWVCAELMKSFYGRMRTGAGPAEALRQAKRAMLRSPTPAYRHPYFWAPFVVVGLP